MEHRLKLACEGKTFSANGLNIPDFKEKLKEEFRKHGINYDNEINNIKLRSELYEYCKKLLDMGIAIPNGIGINPIPIGNPIRMNVVENKKVVHNGTVYIGEVVNNKKHGLGKMTYQDGSIYDGHWVNDLRHGKGVFSKIDHEYEGNWVNDELKTGSIRYNCGFFYSGQLFNFARHGKGIMTYNNGNVYDGNWIMDRRNGHGIMEYSNGDVYNGNWDNHNINGRGIMEYANGDVYDGEWKNNMKNKYGKLIYKNGDVYEGLWLADEMFSGSMTYINGDYYHGAWQSNKKHFQGTMKYNNGNMYVGEWKNDKRNGEGTMTYSNGTTHTGMWENDIPALMRHSKYRIKSMNKFDELTKWMQLCKTRELTKDEYNKLHTIILTIDPNYPPITPDNLRTSCTILSIDYELTKIAADDDNDDEEHILLLLKKLNSLISVQKQFSDYKIKNTEECKNDNDISGNDIRSQNVLKLGDFCFSYTDIIKQKWHQLNEIKNPYTNELFSRAEIDLIRGYVLSLQNNNDIHNLEMVMPDDVAEFKSMLEYINTEFPNQNSDDFFNLTLNQINKLIDTINNRSDSDIKLVVDPKDHMDIYLQFKHNIEELNTLENYLPSVFYCLENEEPFITYVKENNDREDTILKNGIELNKLNIILKKTGTLNFSKKVYRNKYYSTMPEVENLLLKVKYLIFKYRWLKNDNIIYKFEKFLEDIQQGKYDNKAGLYHLIINTSKIYLHLLDGDWNDDSFPDVIRNIDGYFDIFVKSKRFAKYLLESNSLLCVNAKFEFIANKLLDSGQVNEKYIKLQKKIVDYLTDIITKICSSNKKLTKRNIRDLIVFDNKFIKLFEEMITLYNVINKKHILNDDMLKYLIEEILLFENCETF